ncbi:hypothetical protein [Pseudomonas gingeri]|uniref:hypothetical protein n=1 Tax=Pseudomonas gingeri TaxID=117681 RepID=UPI0015A3A2D2|nr:hypothetical protein [Pseudomonas gingeri]NWE46376.1 hypothetical protein [Pseudomonas gingeri]
MNEVKRYHLFTGELAEGCGGLGRINVVLCADHDRVTAERDALQQLLNQRDEQVETLKLQHQDEAAACAHEWTDDGEFTLTCTKCGKTENHEPYGWVQTRGNAINHFTQEWDVVESWEDQGFEYKAMFDHAEQPAPVAVADLTARLAAQTALLKELYNPLLEAAMEYDDKFEALAEEVAELIKIEDIVATEKVDRESQPAIHIPRGPGEYDGLDNGVD